MKFRIAFLLFIITTAHSSLLGQSLTQTIRGTVIDRVSQSPLPGATVILLSSSPVQGVTADPEGNFKLINVPVGNHALKISFVGYKDQTLLNIVVSSGKEVILSIKADEDPTILQTVDVTPTLEKNKPLNEMAVVSARTFSVEETRKYAAAVNDPSRMAASYAGVVQTSDGNNTISIRGNSPYGLLWRMEGVDIPNPNHFANIASSGGGISILSSQLLTNSDFLTGAFPAEYGNALAGVFDLNLRKGNNEKHEYTVQAGFLGLDFAAEGPIAKDYKGSYLINYRYSTLSVLSKLKVNVGEGITDFQDLSYNIFLPTKKAGNFSLFGFGGLSSQTTTAKKDSSKWDDDADRYTSAFYSNTGAAGIKHAFVVSPRTFIQTTIVASGNNRGYKQFRLDSNYISNNDYRNAYINKKITISSVINHKYSARLNQRAGIYLNRYYFNLLQKQYNYETKQLETPLDASGGINSIQLFSQWSYKMNDRLTLNGGLHYFAMPATGSTSTEPRGSLKYEINDRQWFSFGYGSHSQMQPTGVYVARLQDENGNWTQPNKKIGFNKARHFVLAYDRSITQFLHVKLETYYQQLYHMAVFADITRPVSISNNDEGYITDPLVNKGTGRNYGAELTIEQFTHNDFYCLLSSSLYDSKYKALDGLLRNSRYNGNYAFAFTAGKEFRSSRAEKNKIYGINLRTLYSGGFRTTPIDYAASARTHQTKYIESESFSEKLPDYFRSDFRISVKRNRARCTTTLALDIQNVSNHKNLYGTYFDPQTGKIKTSYQLPLLPILSYKIEF